MSGKKQKVPPAFFQCSKCQRRFTRQSVTKHHDLDCEITLPFVEDGNLFVNINKTTKNTLSEIKCLPFTNVHRISSGILFLSEVLIQECCLQAFGWVSVLPVQKNDDGSLLQCEENSKGYALIVWPLVNQTTKETFPSLMIDRGFKFNSGLLGRVAETFCYKIQRLGSLPFSFASPIFKSATELTLELDDFSKIEGVNFELERFVQIFHSTFVGRVVSNGNRFQIRFYTEMIPFKVTNIKTTIITPSQNLGSISSKLAALSLNSLQNQETIDDFFEITRNTVIHMSEKSDCSSTLKSRIIEDENVRFCDVGGLDPIIKEIVSTVEFMLSSNTTAPKGLLLYGHTGTGKSMLVKAICSHFHLNKITLSDISSIKHSETNRCTDSLTNAFNQANLRSPSAVIIENIDTFVTKRNNSAYQDHTFVADLRSKMQSLSCSSSKVILLATAADMDSVDADVKSYNIFGKEIEIPVPSAPDRKSILGKILKSVNHTLNEEDIISIASGTHGFVGADLQGLCSQSALRAVQKRFQNLISEKGEITVCVEDFLECIKWVKPSAMRSILVDVPNVRWSDIGGQEHLKFQLKQAIEWPLKHPEAFQRLGIKPPKGILMYGPPGCSKTMIAKAIATESGLNFISVKGSELFSKWVGESEKAVQTLFRKARQVSPSVVFFDEIDSLGGERGTSTGSSNVHERVLAQLLVEIDGIVPLKDVTIVAATNRPDIIDPVSTTIEALLRPGRLDRIIYVPMPDKETRKDILKVSFKKMPVDSQVDINKIAHLTDGYSGAEVTAVCHEAALKALQDNIEAKIILERHFVAALDAVSPRISKEQIKFYENYYKSRKLS